MSKVTSSTSTLLKSGNITKDSLGWPAVSEAIRGRPGYIIYCKRDKYKEIRRYISIFILQ